MSRLILLRHGESLWNASNLFTGWVDVPLSPKGIAEALSAGDQIKDIPIDIIFTSRLCRAQNTATLAMTRHPSTKTPIISHFGEEEFEAWSKIHSSITEAQTIPIICAWELNERMYGELQGLNKKEVAEKYGVDQVQIWRRSYDVAPPGGESLAMTAARTLPYFKKEVLPLLRDGKNVFICAHGNSLRSIIMELDQLTPEQIIKFELPTGLPLFYRFENDRFWKES
jgi:2,3-bisphosphoglycerate-dependent phosphoglycerate mutase